MFIRTMLATALLVSTAALPAVADVTEAELIKFARARLAGFATPKHVVFCELPKTSTGKIQKFELRALAKTL